MNIYGNIPKPGDRTVAMMVARHDGIQWLTLPGGIGATARSRMTPTSLRLVEGVVGGVYPMTHLSPSNYDCVGSVSVALPRPDGNGMSTAQYSYDGYGVRTTINMLGVLDEFARFNDDQLRTIAQLSFPQVLADSNYVRMIRDIRGDDTEPSSIGTAVAEVERIAADLGVQFVRYPNPDTYCSTASLDSDGGDADRTQAAIDEFERMPRARLNFGDALEQTLTAGSASLAAQSQAYWGISDGPPSPDTWTAARAEPIRISERAIEDPAPPTTNEEF